VYCQLESIRQCVKLSTLRKALSTLPKTLDETYDRILQNIESAGQRPDAITALRWLCFSHRPLLLSEIVEVLAIENGDSGGFCPDERLPDPADVMVICSSLISCSVVSEEDHEVRVRLAHFSVKEYLLSDRCPLRSDLQMPTCHMAIAESCLHYLLFLFENLPLTKNLVDHHPLSQYAAEYWWQHAQSTDHPLNLTVINLARRLLMNKDAGSLPWVQLYNVDRPRNGLDLSLTKKDLPQPLYYAASIGALEIIENMTLQDVDVKAEGGYYGNALQAASYRGYEKVVQMLLDAGADVKAGGGYYGNALQAASYRGYEKVVQILLDAGADVKAKGGRYSNALQAASYGGSEKVVQILLDAGADVKAKGGYYGDSIQVTVVNHESKLGCALHGDKYNGA
jgi:hypothetical protein